MLFAPPIIMGNAYNTPQKAQNALLSDVRPVQGPTYHPTVSLPQEVLESCVKYVRTKIPNLPLGDAADRFPNTEPFEGSVAIFWYPPSDKYPEGTKHIAYVEKIDGSKFYISQTNKLSGKYSEEWIDFSSPFLIGFYTP